MKRGGGRAKGNSYERQVAAMFVKAFALRGITGADCYRTPSSGGHRYAKQQDPGDLVLSPKFRKLWNVSVECKHYKKLDALEWQKLFTGKPSLFSQWWQQAVAAAKAEHGVPLLVFRQNHGQSFAMFSRAMYSDAEAYMDGIVCGKIPVRIVLLDELLGYVSKRAKG